MKIQISIGYHILMMFNILETIFKLFTVTSSNIGHSFANSGNPDETAPYKPSHQNFHCLLSYFFYSNN